MEITFISAHERIGPLRKAFGLHDGTNRSYPNAARITSHTIEINDEGLEALKSYRDTLVKHAGFGHALYKGGFDKPLVHESRRNRTLKTENTQFLVLDIDGLKSDEKIDGKATKADVKRVAEKVVGQMPPELQSVSYVACASSSFGTSANSLSVHIHFLLETPVSPAALKRWLVSLNYTRQFFLDSLDLHPSKSGIKHPIDPCLADNSRVIYIAPPSFGPMMENPFADDEERIVLVDKGASHLDIRQALMDAATRQNEVEQLRVMKEKELAKKYGISTKRKKTVTQVVDGRELMVISDPDEVLMEFSYDDDDYVRYNIAPSQSNAYWVPRNNPEIVYSFHDGEKPFLFRKACPAAYEEHVRRYGKGFVPALDEDTGDKIATRIEMFLDRNTDKHYTMVHDMTNNKLLELRVQQAENAKEYLRFKGQVVPDPIPSYYIEMNTKDTRAVFNREGEQVINRFVPTKYMLDESPHWSVDSDGISHLTYGQAWMVSLDCPLISEIILHLIGNDLDCFEHFINWFAFIFQTREKTRTAWLAQGTEGTGKGLFYKKIARPLFSARHSKQNTLEKIATDQFNDWMEDVFFLMVDEFDMSGANAGIRRVAGQLKNMITEPTFMMRAMQRSQEERRQEMNFFWATNESDAMQWVDKRRVNVAPKQNIPLRERLPMVMLQEREFDTLLDAELDVFAQFLRSFKVSFAQVRETLNNEAKHAAQEAGMTSDKRFLSDIGKGNFAAFAEYLDKQEDATMPPAEFQTLRRVKQIITEWIPFVNTGRRCAMRLEDLRIIYGYLADKTISQNAFGRMISNNNIDITRTRNPVGLRGQKLTSAAKCIEAKWSMDDAATLDLIRDQYMIRPAEQEAGRVKPIRGEAGVATESEYANDLQSSW